MKKKDNKADNKAQVINIGDVVEWKSQAAGSATVKRGTVVYVLKPDEYVSAALFSMEKSKIIENRKRVDIQFDLGSYPRDHESYIVLVNRGDGKKKPCLYFPRVRGLKVVTPVS